jgi:GNAT superfamily N-acetyltransferase
MPKSKAQRSSATPPSELPSGYIIRPATNADTATIARHRRAMFEDIGTPGDLDLVEQAFADWLGTRLDRTYFHWLAEHEGRPIGSAGVMLLDWPPSPRDPRGGLGFIYNVYVHAGHRRRGIAKALMLGVHDWARRRELGAVALHASDDGQPLYEALGYVATNEMRLDLMPNARGRTRSSSG